MRVGLSPVPDFSAAASAAWHALLPDDIRAMAGDGPGGEDGEDVAALISDLSALAGRGEEGPWLVPGIVSSHQGAVEAFGRPRRLRLLAWVTRCTYPDAGVLLKEITDEGGGTDGSGGGNPFLEDIRAHADAIGHRTARLAVTGPNVDAAATSAFILENELAFARGGL